MSEDQAPRNALAPPPLELDEAARLDERIRSMAKATKSNLDALNHLIENARAGQIHTALGYETWTAYLGDAVGELCTAVDADTRREIAVMLHHQGMSIRDSAEATGQSKSTVQRQVSQSGTVEGTADVTVGHDGKVRRRERDEATEVTSPTPKPITASFHNTSVDLGKRVARLSLLTYDDRFDGNRGTIVRHDLENLISARKELSRVIKQLKEESSTTAADVPTMPEPSVP